MSALDPTGPDGKWEPARSVDPPGRKRIRPEDDDTTEEEFGAQPEDGDTTEDELVGAQPEDARPARAGSLAKQYGMSEPAIPITHQDSCRPM